jgi:uncharacterized protein YbaA (DUF1428 family)
MPTGCTGTTYPRLIKRMKPKAMPFDSKRMAYGGFKVMVDV